MTIALLWVIMQQLPELMPWPLVIQERRELRKQLLLVTTLMPVPKGAIAIGSGNSTTQVSSTGINAIALGALANSSQENSLALGANSVARQ
jgi:hypothetical protein